MCTESEHIREITVRPFKKSSPQPPHCPPSHPPDDCCAVSPIPGLKQSTVPLKLYNTPAAWAKPDNNHKSSSLLLLLLPVLPALLLVLLLSVLLSVLLPVLLDVLSVLLLLVLLLCGVCVMKPQATLTG